LKVWFSRHALSRMAERRVGRSEVLECLNEPVQHVYDRWNDVYVAVSSRGFAVVYAAHGDRLEVLTVLGRREYEALMKRYGFKRYKLIS
jgi:hypothetical protein